MIGMMLESRTFCAELEVDLILIQLSTHLSLQCLGSSLKQSQISGHSMIPLPHFAFDFPDPPPEPPPFIMHWYLAFVPFFSKFPLKEELAF